MHSGFGEGGGGVHSCICQSKAYTCFPNKILFTDVRVLQLETEVLIKGSIFSVEVPFRQLSGIEEVTVYKKT